MTRTIAAILTAATLTTAPIAVQAAERKASPIGTSEKLAGSEPITIIGAILGLAAAIAIAIVVLDEDDEDEPASP